MTTPLRLALQCSGQLHGSSPCLPKFWKHHTLTAVTKYSGVHTSGNSAGPDRWSGTCGVMWPLTLTPALPLQQLVRALQGAHFRHVRNKSNSRSREAARSNSQLIVIEPNG
jgi:hypothetical protein